jgi:hypothetical protein
MIGIFNTHSQLHHDDDASPRLRNLAQILELTDDHEAGRG